MGGQCGESRARSVACVRWAAPRGVGRLLDAYWMLLEVFGCYWRVPDATGCYWMPTGCYWRVEEGRVLRDATGLYWMLLDATGGYRTLLGGSWVVPDATRWYRALLAAPGAPESVPSAESVSGVPRGPPRVLFWFQMA